MKGSFHFNKDHPTFFKNVHRCLKDNGKLVIIHMGTETRLPWTHLLQNKFIEILLLATDFIPKDIFDYKIVKNVRPRALTKEFYIPFLKERGWSNLLTHTQEEIDEGIEWIKKQEPLPDAIL